MSKKPRFFGRFGNGQKTVKKKVSGDPPKNEVYPIPPNQNFLKRMGHYLDIKNSKKKGQKNREKMTFLRFGSTPRFDLRVFSKKSEKNAWADQKNESFFRFFRSQDPKNCRKSDVNGASLTPGSTTEGFFPTYERKIGFPRGQQGHLALNPERNRRSYLVAISPSFFQRFSHLFPHVFSALIYT